MLPSPVPSSGSAQLAQEMWPLRQRCRKIVWLNPLIGWREYTPQARGMDAALAYIDLFAPAHTSKAQRLGAILCAVMTPLKTAAEF
jgi:uncharacterized protein with von Willebrand factor type A (vWA) domain